jgi:hypothetical protein
MAQGDQTVFSKEIGAFAQMTQDLEAAISGVLYLRDVGTATGQTLDNVGDQVGQDWPTGMSDNDYRALIRAKIVMNLSGGEPERLISAVRALTNATVINYYESYPCNIWIDISATSMAANLWTLLKRLVVGGVALNLRAIDSALPFRFDSATNGLDQGKLCAPIT